ncbi:uncharacterized protein YALI1_F04860g [Yarrowia lipolytica]|uniref:Uncharacterized protein n=1 Tax=Yarrowia lipolytica TaxID=4952 RepID=A0A1D8NLS6_YARLL|nr:hypothetical protein YALI1_F04860g [Yarrowia lipolytica]
MRCILDSDYTEKRQRGRPWGRSRDPILPLPPSACHMTWTSLRNLQRRIFLPSDPDTPVTGSPESILCASD